LEHHLAVAVFAVAVIGFELAAAPASPVLQRDASANSSSLSQTRAPGAALLHLAVVLRFRHEDELRALVDAESVPGSPIAHRALSAAQFSAAFAPSAADYARTAAVLVRHGMRVTHTYANRGVIDVLSPLSAVEQTFATAIAATRRDDGSVRYFNVKPIVLPPDLVSTVYGVAGFDTGAHTRPAPHASGSFSAPNIAPGPPLEGPATGFGPEAYARAYDFPDRHHIAGMPAGTTYDGAGQTVALIADDDFFEYDLDQYLKYFNITRTGPPTNRIKVNGGAQQNGIFSFVTTLQAETLVGLAPGIILNDYGIPELSDASLLDAYNQIDSDDTAAIALSPAFDCEGATTPRYFPKLSDYLALAGTALGIVYITNAGNYDLGVICPGQFTPSGDPHFVSVGGTVMLIDGQGHYRTELASGGSDGGQSAYFALPFYQRGVPGIAGTNRNVPDISFDGDFRSGGASFENGLWTGPDTPVTSELGNELAAAIFTAMAAEWTQIHGAPLGDIHGDLYNAYRRYGYTLPKSGPVFHDITIGNSFRYPAVPGYDRATGIGSIDGWNFALSAHL
jgi:kumamolisin